MLGCSNRLGLPAPQHHAVTLPIQAAFRSTYKQVWLGNAPRLQQYATHTSTLTQFPLLPPHQVPARSRVVTMAAQQPIGHGAKRCANLLQQHCNHQQLAC
jgi:hypothetical protein